MSACCHTTHRKNHRNPTETPEQTWRQGRFHRGSLWHTDILSPSSVFPLVSYLLRQRRVNQLRWKSVCERQVRVFVCEWYATLQCCFSARAALYKSFYSLVSSLKDSGHMRPGGARVKCSCCQHGCGHSRGQRHRTLQQKNGSLHLIPRTEVSMSFSLTYTHTRAFPSRFPRQPRHARRYTQ